MILSILVWLKHEGHAPPLLALTNDRAWASTPQPSSRVGKAELQKAQRAQEAQPSQILENEITYNYICVHPKLFDNVHD